jgi:NADH:ubiquinone oxidoreductase subunit 4 (subunit M)
LIYGILLLTGIPLLALVLPRHFLPQLRLAAIVCQISALLLLTLPLFPNESVGQGDFDQLSLAFLLFTILVNLAILLTERNLAKHQLVALSVLQLSLEVVFLTSHLLTFYGFWIAASLPIAWLLVREGKPQGLRFFLCILLGTVPLLFLIYRVYMLTGSWQIASWSTFEPQAAWQLFIALVLAFGIRLGLFPFHRWLIDTAHCPATITAVVLGPFAKSGIYGLLRIGMPIFDSFKLSLPLTLGILGIVSIFYGSIIGLAQRPGRKAAAWMSLVYGGFSILFLSLPGIDGGRAVIISISSGVALTLYLLSPRAHWCQNLSLLSLMALPGLGSFGSFAVFFQTIAKQYDYIRWPSMIGFLLLLFFSGRLLRDPKPAKGKEPALGCMLLLLSLVWISFAATKYGGILPPL